MADTKFKPLDVSGQRFGYLTAIRRVGLHPKKHNGYVWEFRCVCGNVRREILSVAKASGTISCGCQSSALQSKAASRHRHSVRREASRTYMSWRAMLRRCEYTGDKEYRRYGGAGITVCAAWHSFSAFLADMGERPHGTTLDRIDSASGYSPGNCRWATNTEQARNRSNTIRTPYKGQLLTLAEISERTGIKYATLHRRFKYCGWRGDRLVTSV